MGVEEGVWDWRGCLTVCWGKQREAKKVETELKTNKTENIIKWIRKKLQKKMCRGSCPHMAADLVLSHFLLVPEVTTGNSANFSFTLCRNQEEGEEQQHHCWLSIERAGNQHCNQWQEQIAAQQSMFPLLLHFTSFFFLDILQISSSPRSVSPTTKFDQCRLPLN